VGRLKGFGKMAEERRWPRCEPVLQVGYTPLHFASVHGHLDVVEALLAKGADVEAKDNVSIERAWALCPSLSLTHTHNTLDALRGCMSIPLLLFLKMALQLQGLSSIADTRLIKSPQCEFCCAFCYLFRDISRGIGGLGTQV
jgi:hypothetical protein